MDKKLLVGICLPDKGNIFAYIFIRLSLYMQKAKWISLRPSLDNIDFEKRDALLLSGGNDIDPLLYGGHKDAHNTLLDKKRDSFELEMIDKAYKKKIPILGVCRGAQLINIYFKGSLYPTIFDLDESIIHNNSIFPVKKVIVKIFSKLFTIVQHKEIVANCIHNQAIKEIGKNLKVSATDGKIIEAIEKKDYPFLLGVQWHPEYLLYLKEHRNIFRSFVKSSLSS
ncbi:hypothetical protein CXF72_05550 [Psychromonas sp. MB-3u-54]|uniref:gamma-glutamyl-gamma-aminobutyrate hydrolase family protein n=1 Tax=Psychromonas sp. MB-3u-54 TaxID=2058319 RepID=UPI000C344B11|nr:gamma-glutamyl-gamma-aminobutyrate hydrolase family protein [Psychromonas sp. MB-3u-54]PKH03561.1 hypothetical protein CXF72_05550 [Psychromonas sp. MB-3u-54]